VVIERPPKKDDPWAHLRGPTFPIVNKELVNKIVVTTGIQLRKDID